jgi:branched-chain amino acid transport system substrate-binding protein
MALLIKANRDAVLKVDYYTYYAGIVGGPAAIGEAGDGRIEAKDTVLPTTCKMQRPS